MEPVTAGGDAKPPRERRPPRPFDEDVPMATAASSSASQGRANPNADDESGRPAKKRGRGRKGLSCVACHKRKIACTKVFPCLACANRGESRTCAPMGNSQAARDLAAARNGGGPTAEQMKGIRDAAEALKKRAVHLESLLGSFFNADGQAGQYDDEDYLDDISPEPDSLPALPAAPPAQAHNLDLLALASGSTLEQAPNYPLQLQDLGHYGLPPQQPQPQQQQQQQHGNHGHGVHSPMGGDVDVTAAVNLEIYAVGWERAEDREHRSAVRRDASSLLGGAPSRAETGPYAVLADHRRSVLSIILGTLPNSAISQRLVEFALEETMWMAGGVVHAPHFLKEHAEFLGWGAVAADYVNPPWLSLYLSILCMGVRYLPEKKMAEMNITAEQKNTLAKDFFNGAVQALYQSQWLEVHSFYSLQTVSIFVLALQDMGTLSLHSTFLASAIRIAQHMNLHRMESDSDFLTSASLHTGPVGDALVLRELKKRVWYGLIAEDNAWAQHRCGYTLSTRSPIITTPLPLNLHAHDFADGRVAGRPATEPTIVSKTLIHVSAASFVRDVFDATYPTNRPLTTTQCLTFVEKLRVLALTFPDFVRADANLQLFPAFVSSLRRWWLLCEQHMLLLTHRSVLSHSFTHPTLSFHRYSATSAASSSIRIYSQQLAPNGETMMDVWMEAYHVLEAALLLILDSFHSPPSSSQSPDFTRGKLRDIRTAVEMLRKHEGSSAFATRSVHILENMLNAEAKRASVDGSHSAAASTSTAPQPIAGPSAPATADVHPFPVYDTLMAASNSLFHPADLGGPAQPSTNFEWASHPFTDWSLLESFLEAGLELPGLSAGV